MKVLEFDNSGVLTDESRSEVQRFLEENNIAERVLPKPGPVDSRFGPALKKLSEGLITIVVRNKLELDVGMLVSVSSRDVGAEVSLDSCKAPDQAQVNTVVQEFADSLKDMKNLPSMYLSYKSVKPEADGTRDFLLDYYPYLNGEKGAQKVQRTTFRLPASKKNKK